MAGSSKALLPLEALLDKPSLLKDLDIARQSQLYSHLDRPSQAAVLSCLDAKELPILSQNGGGLSVFIHRNRPTVFVHLMARLVGVEEREKKVIWLVDDGTGLVAVHHTYRPMLPLASRCRQTVETQARSSKSKGKQRQIEEKEEKLCAIPSQYRLPPPPPRPAPLAPMTPRLQGSSMTTEMRSSIASAFQIGDLLSIVGRVEVWRWSDERLVVVDRVLQKGGLERSNREGYIERRVDANEEPRHLLQAILLSATEYSALFEIPACRTERRIREMADGALNVPASAVEQQQQQQQPLQDRNRPPIIEKRKALRVMNDIPDRSSRLQRKGTLGVPRRTVESDVPEKVETSVPQRVKQTTEAKMEEPSTTIPRRRRQMRRFTKLSDAQMTESTFRVYVEAHIVESCSGRYSLAEACAHLQNLHLHLPQRRGGATAAARKRRKSGIDALHHLGPPSFSLKYLMHVSDLGEHAKRTVEVATKRREEKRMRRNIFSLSTMGATPVASREMLQDKVKRLYMSVIQAMLLDGVIVLASLDSPLQPPFDGSITRQSDVYAFPENEGKSAQRADSDTYQVVTLSLLVEPIYQIVSSSPSMTMGDPSSAQLILTKMQQLDERWRYIQEDSVRECLQLLSSLETGEQRARDEVVMYVT